MNNNKGAVRNGLGLTVDVQSFVRVGLLFYINQ